MADRIILHSDLNSFFASVEIMRDPSLRDTAMAVCGDAKERHGIVLAKSEKAKRAGVQTAMANWEALRLCPGLIMVPPHYEQYKKYSILTRAIYQRFTDQVEPFGMDECWLDVTGSTRLFGTGEEIAHTIRETVKRELGLTVSVGVSFNKVFAKLGSDMKKPDAVTVISWENYREKVWPLPVEDLLFVGKSTLSRLEKLSIHTIGDLAKSDPALLSAKLGKAGGMLWRYANGLDDSPVAAQDAHETAKSVSHGRTFAEPVTEDMQVRRELVELSQRVARKLREEKLAACGVQLAVKDEQLHTVQFQKKLRQPTQNAGTLAAEAMELYLDNWDRHDDIRTLTIFAISLVPEDAPVQQSFLEDGAGRTRQRALDHALDELHLRFGEESVYPSALLSEPKEE